MVRLSRWGLAAIVSIALIGGLALGAVLYVRPLQAQGPTIDELSQVLESIYANNNPSVVSLLVQVPVDAGLDGMIPFVEPDPDAPQQPNIRVAQGSGFVYDNQGHIVTNAHVVHAAIEIAVNFSNGLTLPATIVGIAQDAEIAVIQVDPAQMPQEARPLSLADSDLVTVGTRVAAIGNPYGLNGTMTEGIISAVNRSLPQDTFNIPYILQTDAAINPGNSGGPLVNMSGEVLGVVTAIRPQASGLSFAVPSNIARLMADQLITSGRVEHSYLGILGQTLTTDVLELLGEDSSLRGVLVVSVRNDGPALQAGIRASTNQRVVAGVTYDLGGDIITAIDGRPIRVFEDLLGYLFTRTRPGDTVTLTILRDGQQIEVPVTLSARPTQ